MKLGVAVVRATAKDRRFPRHQSDTHHEMLTKCEKSLLRDECSFVLSEIMWLILVELVQGVNKTQTDGGIPMSFRRRLGEVIGRWAFGSRQNMRL